MNSFFRTTPGKIMLFCLCVISVTSFVFCSGAAIVMLEEDFYTKPLDALYTPHNDLSSIAHDILWCVLPDGNYTYQYADYMVLDPDGNPLTGHGRISGGTVVYVRAYYDDNGEPEHFQTVDSASGDNVYTVMIGHTDPFLSAGFISGTLVGILYNMRYSIYGFILGAFVLALVSFILLMRVCGKMHGNDTPHSGLLGKVPFDIEFTACITFVIIVLGIASELIRFNNDIITIAVVVCAAIAIISDALLFLCAFAVHIRCRSLIKKSFIRLCCRFALKVLQPCINFIKSSFCLLFALIKEMPLMRKTILGIIVYCTFEFFLAIWLGNREDIAAPLFFLEKGALIFAVLYFMIMLKRLQKGAKAIASGDMSSRIDTAKMLPELRSAADTLNSISLGMSRAVEERMKSERMKLELITNVSHDIKTPLTSIINYASLISEEQTENEKIKEYSATLVTHSTRLKRLLEDLVEATKAGTGNLDVQLSPCSATMFITQAAGEYEDRLRTCGLNLVVSCPKEDVLIMADGRRMSRIFDNLLNNICKYALSGTRVYMNLSVKDGFALFEFKNTSRDALNISEEELMERFVRGDSSRNTEGSGLGLSIARSMAELQGGKMKLTIDGDLFKAQLSFPTVR